MTTAAWADTTIGDINNGWAAADSYSAYTIPSNKTLTLTFTLTNYSGDWGGYVFSLTNNTVDAPQFGGNNGYVWFRSPDFAWNKSDWNTGAVVSNTNTKGSMLQADWQAFIKDATTVMAIQRYGTQVFIKTTVTKEATSYTHYFVSEIGTTSDVKAFLCADAAVITISNDALTDTENVDAVTATIGAVGNDGGFAASPVTTLEPESTLTMHFTNHSAKSDNFNNYGIELVYSGYYANIVLGGNRWGELLFDKTDSDPVTTPVTKEEVTYNPFADGDFLNKMDGADVTLTIARSGRVVTITAVHAPADNGTPFTLKYTLEPNATAFPNFATENISVNLSTDHSHITYKFPIAKINTTISAYGWSTFSSDYALDFGNAQEGLEAFTITGQDAGVVALSPVTGTIPAGTGLVLKGTASTPYNIPIVGSSATDVSTNLLKAGTGALVAEESGYTKYVLGVSGGKAAFQKITSTPATVNKGQAYLQFIGSVGARELLFDNESTGITNNKHETISNNRYFDLQGREVAQPTRGLYIVDGRKVIVK